MQFRRRTVQPLQDLMGEGQHIRSRLDRYAEPAGKLSSPFVPQEFSTPAGPPVTPLEPVERTQPR
jgi:hypothetical protein